MNDSHALIETEARHQIRERLARASAPRVPATSRHRLAQGLRRVADRLDG